MNFVDLLTIIATAAVGFLALLGLVQVAQWIIAGRAAGRALKRPKVWKIPPQRPDHRRNRGE